MSIETVKVIVRCRPLNNREKSLNCKEVVAINSNRGQCSISNPSRSKDPPKTFFFDGAFDSNSNTEEIYADIVYPLVEGVTEGYNGTIFAYGQTGCGKTYTMQGLSNEAANKGIISRSFEHIFETIAASSGVKFLVRASFLEIYNEELGDLLGKDLKIKCELKEHPEKGVFVSGLSMHKVKCVEDCKLIMERGWKNRHVGSTLMNSDSSRSHSIFTIYLEMVNTNEATDSEHLRAGKLNLVDLAGSERQSKTGATGDRLKEATKINLSLSALGNVISALVDANSRHVPYRDSKLTRLLQDSLGGNTKTLMIACLSPADNNYDETLSTLRYANRAKNIKNKPVINEDPKDALLRQYQEEIARLKAMLEGKIPTEIARPSALEIEEFDREKRKIEEDYERRLREKEAQFMEEAANRVKLQEEIVKLKELMDMKIWTLEEKYRLKSLSSDEPKSAAPASEGLPTLRLDNLTTQHSSGEEDSDAPWSPRHGAGVREGALSSRTYRLSGSGSADVSPIHLNATPPHDGISLEYDRPSKEELLRRLHLLEADMVGGEEANNVEVRERRSRRRRHAEERRRLLAEANALLDETTDDDGIMLGIYESIQDELRHKSKLLQREKQKTSSLEAEIEDLQREFELDREDYLESIRKQNRQICLLQAILDKVQPCIRRDSNYSNLDKIKKLACYDEETNEWILPALTVERTVLPLSVSANAVTTPPDNHTFPLGRSRPVGTSGTRVSVTGIRDPKVEKEEEARLYAKLTSRSQNHTKYFTNKRMEQLLLDAASVGSNGKSTHPLDSRSSQTGKDSFLNNSNCHPSPNSIKRSGKGKLKDSLSSSNIDMDL